MTLPSTAGYADEADILAVRYETLTFEGVHHDILHLVPPAPQPGMTGRALDIGAGTGRDAAALARRGFAVTAAEPTVALRAHGERLHAGLNIAWRDDALPDLSGLQGQHHDLVFLTAVWMHLDAGERARAMMAVAPLVGPSGRLFLSLRHGPVPPGRRMFDVPAGEVIDAALQQGLSVLYRGEKDDAQGRGDVRWSVLVFERR